MRRGPEGGWRPWLLGALFLALGLGAVGLLEVDRRRNVALLQDAISVADHLSRVRVNLALAYASASRAVAGDPTVSPASIRAPLESARIILDDWARGRSGLAGIEQRPPDTPEYRRLVEDYQALVDAFSRTLLEGGVGAEGDDGALAAVELHVAFAEAERGARSIEERAQGLVREALADDETAHFQRILGWLLLVLLAGAGLVAVGRARIRAESERVAADRRYASLVRHAPIGIASTTREGRIVQANEAFAHLLGYPSAEELRGADLDLTRDVYLKPEDRVRVVEGLERDGAIRGMEMKWRRADGAEIWVRAHGVRREEGSDDPEAFVTDVTQERNLEAQLNQAQKMEAVGTLAGGIAHDFNNLLTPILVNADFALEDLGPDHPVRTEVEEIRGAALRASELTARILTFSRKRDDEGGVADLNQVLEGVESLLRRTLPRSIEVEVATHPEPCLVPVDAGRLEQVIMNLAVNARDAMPAGGALVLETRRVVLDEAYAHEHLDVEPGAYVTLDVSDDGMGMNEATRNRIFDPFFTTKEVGKGTGLGLSTVYGIVDQAGGHVKVYSEPGQGTLFRIYLPDASDAAATPPGESPAATRPLPDPDADTIRTTLLVVDDDERVRAAAVRSLERHGHEVLEAAHPEEALEILAAEGDRIRLLLTDVVLPGMGGQAFAEAAADGYPELRILFMSGYTERSVRRRAGWAEGRVFLHKPFTAGELRRQVQERLQAPV
jgi:two-component system, cell cycle sensor histidine kinase and response regulator CckA